MLISRTKTIKLKHYKNLQIESLSPSLKLFEELMKTWSGFTLTGKEADEDFNELKRSPRLMNPQNYESLFKTT